MTEQIDIYNLRAQLLRRVEKDSLNNKVEFYDDDYIKGCNYILDHLTDITGVNFKKIRQCWDIM